MEKILSFFHHLQLVTIFGLLGNIISFLVFLSPIPTFYRIYKKKSTEGYQSLPYVFALFSSILWILYALISPNSLLLKTINSFGIFIETIYITIFLVYATRKAKITALKLLVLTNVVGLGIIVLITFLIAKTTKLRIAILGWICLVFSLCVFVAPLGVVRQVIRTKSIEYMPFLLSFFLTISAVMWFLYGILKKDMFVAIPNVLGFVFGILQMILYAIYRKSSKFVIEEKIASKLETTNDHQIIEIVKIDQPKENHGEAPQLTVLVSNTNNHHNVDGEQMHSIGICNWDQEMIDRIKMESIEAKAPANHVIVTT